jgi:hypothetical protein
MQFGVCHSADHSSEITISVVPNPQPSTFTKETILQSEIAKRSSRKRFEAKRVLVLPGREPHVMTRLISTYSCVDGSPPDFHCCARCTTR